MTKLIKSLALLLAGLLSASLLFACAESPFTTDAQKAPPATVMPEQTTPGAVTTAPPVTTAPIPGYATVPTVPTPEFYGMLLRDEVYYIERVDSERDLFIISDGQYISVSERYGDTETFYDTGTNTIYTLEASG